MRKWLAPVLLAALTQPAAESPRSGLPRKGMLLQDVDALVGSAAKSNEGKGRVTAEFVEGVLIRYRITSE